MPKFETMPLLEAQRKSLNGQLFEYPNYSGQLEEGKAGSLEPGTGETLPVVRRRLNAAEKLVGKELTVKRADNRIYFWLTAGAAGRNRRRGRPRKTNR